MNIWLIYSLGVLGALAPDIARWHKRGGKFVSSWKRFLALILFALVGGVVAVILPAGNYYAAFYTGATWDLSMSAILHSKGKTKQMVNTSATPSTIIAPSFFDAIQGAKTTKASHASLYERRHEIRE